MEEARSVLMDCVRCHARVVYNTILVVVGFLLLLVAFASFSRVPDEQQDLLYASRMALGRHTSHSHHGPSRSALDRRPWHDAEWVTRVIQSGTPTKAGGYSVLVTGAAGFIGTFTAMAMTKKGWGVVGLDNFNDYYDPALKLAREKLMYKDGRIFVVHGDINDESLISALFDTVRFTHVVHLAAQAGVRSYGKVDDDPLSFVQSDVGGLVTLLEVCARANPQPTFVWASSSSVYGLNDGGFPFSEADETDRPASLYAATKKAGEEIVHVYHHVYGLSVTTLRFFTVYGPYGRPDMAIFNFTRSILDQTPICIYMGGPENSSVVSRDFTYIDDIVNGIVAAVETAAKSTGFRDDSSKASKQNSRPPDWRVFNLGSSRSVPVEEMVSLLESFLGMKAVIQYETLEANAGGMPYSAANLSLAEKHLGYSPRTSLEIGLKKFVLWYLKYTDRDPKAAASAPGRSRGGSTDFLIQLASL